MAGAQMHGRSKDSARIAFMTGAGCRMQEQDAGCRSRMQEQDEGAGCRTGVDVRPLRICLSLSLGMWC